VRFPESDGFSLPSPSSVQKFISEDRLPHLLFYGPPGTGKTSTILACAKQLYKDKEFGSMVLEVNWIYSDYR
jgi:replication factor C subunit 3/5